MLPPLPAPPALPAAPPALTRSQLTSMPSTDPHVALTQPSNSRHNGDAGQTLQPPPEPSRLHPTLGLRLSAWLPSRAPRSAKAGASRAGLRVDGKRKTMSLLGFHPGPRPRRTPSLLQHELVFQPDLWAGPTQDHGGARKPHKRAPHQHSAGTSPPGPHLSGPSLPHGGPTFWRRSPTLTI